MFKIFTINELNATQLLTTPTPSPDMLMLLRQAQQPNSLLQQAQQPHSLQPNSL